MRLALIFAFVLVVAAPARAEVFVAVDGPSRSVSCVAASRELVVASRDGFVEVSVGGGSWQRLFAAHGCPQVAAAVDGTAVIADEERLVVRRPGGAFGAPVALGRDAEVPALAAAPGGWVAAAWSRLASRRTERSVLTGAIVSPSGAVKRTTLARGAYFEPRVAVRPDGTATVAWDGRRSWKVVDLPSRASRALGGGVGTRFTSGGLALTDRLIAWAADDGIRVQVAGEPLAIVSPMTDGAAVVAAQASDGTAVVAFAGADNEIYAVDRLAGGAWSAPHQLTIASQGQTGDFSLGGLPGIGLVAADGGRVAAAWGVGTHNYRGRVVATTGVAGGAWSPASFVSLPTRDAGGLDLSLDASGAPRLLFGELSSSLGQTGRLREARIAAAPAADTTPPVVSARFPSRLPDTATGRIRIPVSVSCSEACDVRVQVTVGDAVARSVAAGVRTTVRLRGSSGLAQSLLLRTRDHHLRVRLEVADQAGNLVRRSAVVRVRVLPRPLRSFKVGPRHDFAMFSRAGDRAVGRMVNAMIDGLASGWSYKTLVREYDKAMTAIDRRFGEVTDTAVLDEIQSALEVPVTRSGYDIEALLTSF